MLNFLIPGFGTFVAFALRDAAPWHTGDLRFLRPTRSPTYRQAKRRARRFGFRR